MIILIDNGRLKTPNNGLSAVAMQYAAALMRANTPDCQFQFLTHPAFEDFTRHAANISAKHIKAKLSIFNKLRKIFNKNIFPYIHNGKEHNIRHAIYRDHLSIPNSDKTPLVFTSHDMYFMSGSKKHIKRDLSRFISTINRADIVCFISEYTRRTTAEHVNLDGKELHVIYNGTDKPANPCRPKWFNENMRPFLFSIAQMQLNKNFHILPPVLSHLPDINLILAGLKKTQAFSLLETAINNERMQSRIFTPGEISESEKAWLLQECAGFVFPSLKEGFGMPIIEALHFGKPVFCFHNTALPEVGGNVAFYWQNDEPKNMADLIRDNILYSPDESIVIARKNWAANFSWDKNAAAYIDIYRSLKKT